MSQYAPLGPDDVGSRVSVRRRLTEPGDGPSLSDVLGILESVSETTLRIRTRGDIVVDVARVDVTASRRVTDTRVVRPPRSATSWTDLELEDIAWTGWPGLEQQRLGDWVLRAAGGFTGRANSALPIGNPGLPDQDAIDHVVAFYEARHLQPRFQVPTPLAQRLDARLDSLGWTLRDPVSVMVADVERVLTGTPTAKGLPPVLVEALPDAAWLDAYHYRGTPLPDQALAVLTSGVGAAFASVRDSHGQVLAIARVAISHGWAGVTAVEVAEHARRRGLGAHVMREVVGWAGRRGARHAYLQVAMDNQPALSLYARMGFVSHHGYHYRLGPT